MIVGGAGGVQFWMVMIEIVALPVIGWKLMAMAPESTLTEGTVSTYGFRSPTAAYTSMLGSGAPWTLTPNTRCPGAVLLGSTKVRTTSHVPLGAGIEYENGMPA